jgi:hypothetical protein
VDALATGDKVNVNDNAFADRFPYVALPNATRASSGASQPGMSQSGTAPGTSPGTAPGTSPGSSPGSPQPGTSQSGTTSSAEAAGNGLPDSDISGMSPAAAPASDDGGGMTPVAYVTGASGIGVLLLALGLFTFLRRRRRRPAGGYQDPNQTMRL